MIGTWRDNNDVKLLINGDEFYPRVFECIRNARTEVILETFILAEDAVGIALQKSLILAARRGARVDVTVDGYGTYDLSQKFIDELVSAGVRLHIFDSLPTIGGVRLNLFRRLHRKLLVVDFEVAFVGGINFSMDHLSNYGAEAKQDYAVEVHGPIVADVRDACMTLLISASSKQDAVSYKQFAKIPTPKASGGVKMLFTKRDNHKHSNDIQRQYLLAIRLAKKRIVIANAYFFPSYKLLRELRRAARRGVEVTLILQGQPDMPWVSMLTRLLYNYLLRAGVKIFEYYQRPLHGKVALADDEWSTVGSSNLDPLSLALNLEANIIIKDATFNKLLYSHFEELTGSHCAAITTKVAAHGYWWRTPLIFLSFHFLRIFPAALGWLPAHSPVLELISPRAFGQKGASPEKPPISGPSKQNVIPSKVVTQQLATAKLNESGLEKSTRTLNKPLPSNKPPVSSNASKKNSYEKEIS